IYHIELKNITTLPYYDHKNAIDLLPILNQEEEVLRFLKAQNPERRLFAACNGMLHEKLCSFFLKKCFGEESLKKKLAAFTDEELLLLIRTLKDWRLRITGKRADMAQANRGGVLTHILDPDSMQVKRDRRIAVTGEMCHVTGRCGGYNLMFALISGIRAGQRI
ncbi:MAG: NAD(P)/FAD-dependent oxidoreductase, partial [Eubacterium sp.]|nr:NAD(P)/FAD-dependent oxidoreductase [Eubacterium sp.]